MRRKASIAVVAGHELPLANRGAAGPASSAFLARDHSRNDYIAAFPPSCAFACCHDATRDFVSESEWERCARGYSVKGEANIGMADAAAGNLYHDLAGPRLDGEKFVSLQTLAGSDQPIAVSA